MCKIFFRNAVFKACARTALQQGEKVTMKHFMDAATEEYKQLPGNSGKDPTVINSMYR